MKPTRSQHAPDLQDVSNAKAALACDFGLLVQFTIVARQTEVQVYARAHHVSEGWHGKVVHQALARLPLGRSEVPAKCLWSLLVDIYAQADRGAMSELPAVVDEQNLLKRSRAHR